MRCSRAARVSEQRWGEEFARAVRLFRAFHEGEPKQGDIATLRIDEAVCRVGVVEQIRYRATVAGESKIWEHVFSKQGRPLFFVTSDGSRAFIHKGRWRFTERGFITR